MTALERLARWDRKFYSYTLSSEEINYGGPSVGITLKGGNRTVNVDDTCDFQGWDGKSDDVVNNSLTLEEIINLAIDRWYECLTPRMHSVHFTLYEQLAEDVVLPVGVNHWSVKAYNWEGVAKGEMDAITIASNLFEVERGIFIDKIISVREIYVKQ